jgi:hypothetical protein
MSECAPVVTSSRITEPSRSSVTASLIPVIFAPKREDVARHQHTRITSGCHRSSPLHKTLSRAMPVAQPGCPMDHFQTLVNRSPGDLWLCCIGTLLHLYFWIYRSSVIRNGGKKFIGNCILRLSSTRIFPGCTALTQKQCPPQGSRSPGIPHPSRHRVSIRICCAADPG